MRTIEAIAMLTGTRGFADVTLADLIAEADIARATFYKHFRDMKDCLLKAQRHYAQVLLEELEERPGNLWSTLATFASRNPHALAILAEVQVAGEEASLDQHDEIRDRLAAVLREDAKARPRPDLPPGLLVGTVMRVLARQGRQHVTNPAVLSKHIEQWLACYTVEQASTRWQELRFHDSITTLEMDWPSDSTALEAPDDKRLRSRRTFQARKLAILRAVIHTVEQRGYEHTTVREIAAAAGVSREVFYIHYTDKVAAFRAIHEIVFGDVMALCMRAFAQAAEWPEQVWRSGHVFASYFASHPTLARFTFVDSLTSGPASAKHQLDSYMTAFMAFLDPSDRSGAQPAMYWTAQLIAAVIFELGYQVLRADRSSQFAAQLPFATYFTLAPFLGYEAANRFVERKLHELESQASS
ncbi:MAG TPA: TetR/AcrR family transcriptional regulator [Solirubrobacteraceae bacterium]